MNEGKLNNRQFVMIALLIVLCGIAIIGHDYFMAKRASAYEKMSIMLSQEPEYVDYLKEKGYQATPVVEAPNVSFFGFRPDQLRQLAV